MRVGVYAALGIAQGKTHTHAGKAQNETIRPIRGKCMYLF